MKHLEIKVEPYWNVNFFNILCPTVIAIIKVEPYWNVNSKRIINHDLYITIKVESYWNVNIIVPIIPIPTGSN